MENLTPAIVELDGIVYSGFDVIIGGNPTKVSRVGKIMQGLFSLFICCDSSIAFIGAGVDVEDEMRYVIGLHTELSKHELVSAKLLDSVHFYSVRESDLSVLITLLKKQFTKKIYTRSNAMSNTGTVVILSIPVEAKPESNPEAKTLAAIVARSTSAPITAKPVAKPAPKAVVKPTLTGIEGILDDKIRSEHTVTIVVENITLDFGPKELYVAMPWGNHKHGEDNCTRFDKKTGEPNCCNVMCFNHGSFAEHIYDCSKFVGQSHFNGFCGGLGEFVKLYAKTVDILHSDPDNYELQYKTMLAAIMSIPAYREGEKSGTKNAAWRLHTNEASYTRL